MFPPEILDMKSLKWIRGPELPSGVKFASSVALSPKSIFGVSVVVAVRVGHRHYQPVDFGVGRFVFTVAKLFNKALYEVD